MNCEGVRQQLPDYVLGTLSETEDAAIRRHLRGCASCRQDATELDQGVALFAGAAHVAEPPPELRERVLTVLEEEWAEPGTARPGPRRFHFAVQALAAALIVLAGVGAWAGVAQRNANHFREDALAYRKLLGALGGKDVRAGTLVAAPGVTLDGSVALYDSDKGQSWIMVLARAPGFSNAVTVTLQAPGGREITVPFPLKFDSSGEGWTAMVTGANLSSFDHIVLTGANGTVVAEGNIPPE
jgi:anti-sigma factor RsiW